MSREVPSSRRGDARRVVSSGRIRVDAAKAMAKLREHLLVDLHDYALEIVRAAVASEAPRIDVAYDADDVLIAWVGRPIPVATLERLLDHVLTEAKGGEAQRLRLLALGVNAALGLEPAYVEIDAVSPAGKQCTRIRWTPAMLKANESEAPRPQNERVAPPPELGPGAIRVRVHRRVGWSVLRRATLGGSFEEIGSLARATDDLATPLTLNGAPWPRHPKPAVLVRVPLLIAARSEPAIVHAALDVLDVRADASAHEPHLDMLEHGVRLTRYAFTPSDFPGERYVGVPLPVRVVVDARELPTNASRSEVRADSPLYEDIFAAAHDAFGRALEALIAVHSGRAPDAMAWVSDDAAALADALGAFACVAIGAQRKKRKVPEGARALLRLPLFSNACGEPRSFHALEPSAGEALVVYGGEQPIEPALSGWLSSVMWRRGRLVEAVMRSVVAVSADQLIEEARRAKALRDRFLAHAPGDVAVPPSPSHLVCEAFEVTEAPFAGLHGEVAVTSQGPREAATVRVFYQRREIAVFSLPRETCPLALDIAIAWDGRLSPRPAYDGVEDTETLKDAIWYAIRVGVLEVSELARRLWDTELSPDGAAAIRAAVRRAHGVIGLWPAGRTADRQKLLEGGLMTAPVWPTTNGQHLSGAALRTEIARTGVYYVAPERATGRALDHRPVLAIGDPERSWLRHSFPGVPAIDYERALSDPVTRPAFERQRWLALEGAVRGALAAHLIKETPRMRFETDGVKGVIAVAIESSFVTCHAGVVLSRGPYAHAFGPVAIAVDDPNVTPSEDWGGVLAGGSSWQAEDVERQLLATCIAARAGDAASRERLELTPNSDGGALLDAFLLSSAGALERRLAALREGAHDSREGELAELYARLDALPLCTLLDRDGRPRPASLGELDRLHPSPAPVPFLTEAPGFATLDWHPLLVAGVALEPLRRRLGSRLVGATSHLRERQELALRAKHREHVLARAPVDPWDLGELGAHGPVVTRYEADGVTVAVALPPRRVDRDVATVDLVFERRPLFRSDLAAVPVLARVGIEDESWLDTNMTGLTREAAALVAEHVNRAAARLLVELSSRDDDVDAPPPLLHPALARLAAAIAHRADLPERDAVLRALRYKTRWQRVQGGHTALRLAVGRNGPKSVRVGRRLYTDWVRTSRKSRLDDPVVYLPPEPLGNDYRAILSAFGFELEDVTAALEKLSARRAKTSDVSAPTLPGEPIHPALRATIASLRITGLDGEVEVGFRGASSIVLTDLDGARPIEIDVGCAVRAVLSVEAPRSTATDEHVAATLRRAVSLILANAQKKLDELPVDTRHACREHLLFKEKHKIDFLKRDWRAPVFCDTGGDWHSLQALGQQREVWMTSGAPPFPDFVFELPILVLRLDEASVLASLIEPPVLDKSELVSRARSGIARRAAAPILVAIPEALRARCSRVIPVRDATMRGEIGLLGADAAGFAGVYVHIGGRPLCTLSWRGWPAIAMLDFADLEANPFFDRIADDEKQRAITRWVERIVDDAIRQHTKAPPDAIASHWSKARSGALAMSGHFWLPASFPAAPTVRIEAVGALAVLDVPLHKLPPASPYASTEIPVCGHVMVVGALVEGNPHGFLAEVATKAVVKMLGQRGIRSSATLEAVRWNAALLGVELPAILEAPTTEGTVTQPVVEEALRRGKIWWTAGEGSADGQFPGAAPPFILRDPADNPLLCVLRLRAPAVLQELGGWAPPPTAVPVAPAPAPIVAESDGPRTLRPGELSGRPAIAEEPPADEALIVDSWLDGLTRRVISVFKDVPPPAPVSADLREALEEIMAQLHLPRGAVESVAFARSGRPVRYEPEKSRLIVNRDHRAVRALLPADVDEPSSEALIALAAAGTSELNRALGSVTAAEEKHVLLLLMLQRSRQVAGEPR